MKDRIKEFLDHERLRRLSPSTVKIYGRQLGALDSYLKSLDPPCPLGEVDYRVLMGFIVELIKTKDIAPSTQGSYVTALRKFFRWAARRGYIAADPAQELEHPSRRPPPKGALTFNQLVALVNTPSMESEIGRRDAAMIAMFCATAMRVSALCALNVGDVRRDKMEVSKRCRECGGPVLGESQVKDVTIVRLHEKGGKVWDVPLADEAVYLLGLYLQLRGDLGHKVPLFTSTHDGSRLSRMSVYRRLKLHAAAAGITEPLSPHSLRRATIAWWHDYGVPGDTIQAFVGHADPGTTQRYKHITTRSFGLSGISEDHNLLRVMAKRMQLPLSHLFAPAPVTKR